MVINSYICGASFLFRLLQETRKVEGRNIDGEVGSRSGGGTGPSSYSDAIYSASTVTWQCTAGVSLEGGEWRRNVVVLRRVSETERDVLYCSV